MPTLGDFLVFIANVMGIPVSALPTNAPIITYAFDWAMAVVDDQLAGVPYISGSWSQYAIAVYNLAGDRIINFATDQTGQTYFADLRNTLKINAFTPGIVSSTADSSTSTSLEVPDFFKGMTLEDLQLLKTPYGRQYMAIAQKYGKTIWGLS